MPTIHKLKFFSINSTTSAPMGFDWIAPKNYKRHYICLKCQKGFKRPSKKDMKEDKSVDLSTLMDQYYALDQSIDIVQYINEAYQQLRVICPNCQHQMIQVHYNFEVPPQRDDKTWKMLRKRWASKTNIPYDVYIRWHRLALQKTDARSVMNQNLKQNLAKLERESTSE